MANPHRGEVALPVGDKVYTLDLSFNGICNLEQHFDKGIIEISGMLKAIKENPEGIRATTIRALLWGALVEHHPETEINDAGRIMSEAGFWPVVTAIAKAFTNAFPPAKESGDRPLVEATKSGTGTPS